jgi:serine/threonine kinase 16
MVVSALIRLVRWLWECIYEWFQRRWRAAAHSGRTVVTLDTGKRVVVGRQIAEGGFSFVFEAFDIADDQAASSKSSRHRSSRSTTTSTSSTAVVTKYALKRVHCPELDLLTACRREAAVHRAVQQEHHAHVIPLLGFAVQQDDCYLLFPYCSQSLRSVVNQRNPLLARPSPSSHSNTHTVVPPTQAPWPEVVALDLFWQICSGVQALHRHGYSHRDIKLENVLLYDDSFHPPPSAPPHHQQHSYYHAVLMDFGSAGPVTTAALTTRRDVLEVMEQAAQHTTLPYRPPELWEGGIRNGPDVVLDYRCVDVWSLGCTLHALLYGASPFECEFLAPQHGRRPCATMRIVECTHLAILGQVPIPRYAPISFWYSSDIRGRLLEPMLTQDRMQRPTLESIMNVVEELIQARGGTVDRMQSRAPWADDEFSPNFHDEDGGTEAGDGIALLSRVV